ncbi:MAG: hypothetical protein GWP10_12445 [Nitrospiraceae bacterium]|nr:hypothetical protein [Nitrospiraceae bacterium]
MSERKLLVWIQIVFAAGIVLWWTLFFLVEKDNPANTPEYLAFEGSFPPADLGWLVPLLLAAVLGNVRGHQWGASFTLMSGAVLVFLGLLDTSFNLRNGIYARSMADGIVNASINAACLAFGLASVAWTLYILSRQDRIS